MRTAALLGLLLLVAGCRSGDGPTTTSPDEQALTAPIAALDTFAERGMVSINGRVLDHALGERELVLDDGTGLVRVRLPEDPPGLVGHRLFVRGTLHHTGDSPVVEAVEWLYDSTAISIRSD